VSASFHIYTSTACYHGLHDECRLSCKWCREPCCCMCHEVRGQQLTNGATDEDPATRPGQVPHVP